jgi:hypothetical protein
MSLFTEYLIFVKTTNARCKNTTCHYSLSLLEPTTHNFLHRHSVTMSVDFRHASYQMNFLRCIPSSGPYSSSMIANEYRLEAEFRIVSHAIHCNYVSQRAFGSFCCVNDVCNYYCHQVASPPQSNPDHDHLAILPQYEVPCRQPAVPPHQQPQILPK